MTGKERIITSCEHCGHSVVPTIKHGAYTTAIPCPRCNRTGTVKVHVFADYRSAEHAKQLMDS